MRARRKPFFHSCPSISGDRRPASDDRASSFCRDDALSECNGRRNIDRLDYALIALGLTIIFGFMRIVNFAHGEMVVIGMYVGYGIWSVTEFPPLITAPVAALVLFALGYALQRAIVNKFIDRPQHAQFILFIALALIITGLHLVLFGPDSRPIEIIESMQSYTIGPVRLDVVRSQAALMALRLSRV